VSRPPLQRVVVFFVIVTLCLAADVLIVFGLYRAGTALLAGLEWQTLGQAALLSGVLLCLVCRARRTARAPVEQDDHGESIGS
jgi:hypothetical protein